MLIATDHVVEAYVSMGFTPSVIDGRQHKFVRGPLAVIHETVRGVGFDSGFLIQDAGVHGLADELIDALDSLGPLTCYKTRPPQV